MRFDSGHPSFGGFKILIIGNIMFMYFWGALRENSSIFVAYKSHTIFEIPHAAIY